MLTSKGYKISLDDKDVNDYKRRLTVCINNNEYSKKEYFQVYRVSKDFLYIPKYYALDILSDLDKKNLIRNEQNGKDINITFNGSLRDYQLNIFNKTISHLNNFDSGLLSLYTGAGKTILALYILSVIKKKTLIIVHTENLLDQWKEKIIQFLGITPGIIQGKIMENDKDICIGMIQSISQKKYDSNFFKEFGFTIYDEVHHTPGRCFSKIFYVVCTKKNLGLSATLTRSDGLTKVIHWFLGKTIISLKHSSVIPKITIIDSEYFSDEKYMSNNKINIPLMINELCENFERNFKIINIIKEKYKENRKILILSDRRSHLLNLYNLLKDDYSVGLYIGGMKNNKLKESNEKKIILATYIIASEGYDNPELDTLILSTPKSKIEQAVGRILRQKNINEAEVIDIQDNFSIFNNFNNSRLKFYKSKKYLDKIDNSEKFKEYYFKEI